MTIERLNSGVNGLDALLHGGFVSESAIMVRGAPGTGKTTLALQYLLEGVKHEQPGLFVSFEQFPDMLYRDVASLEIDLKAYEEQGLFHLMFTSPEVFYQSLQNHDSPLSTLIRTHDIQRLAIDSLTHFTRLVTDTHELREVYHSVINAIRQRGITALYLAEEVRSDFTHNERGRLSFIMDGILMLRYLEIESVVQRAIVVLKMRASDHDKRFFSYSIKADASAPGIHIEKPIEGKTGLLSALTRKMLISSVRDTY